METFYCVGCRASYPSEKSARLSTAAHRDGEPVGFCFVCVRDVQVRNAASAYDDGFADTAVLEEQQAASA